MSFIRSVHNPKIMLGMLVKVVCSNSIATRRRLPREGNVTFEDLMRRASRPEGRASPTAAQIKVRGALRPKWTFSACRPRAPPSVNPIGELPTTAEGGLRSARRRILTRPARPAAPAKGLPDYLRPASRSSSIHPATAMPSTPTLARIIPSIGNIPILGSRLASGSCYETIPLMRHKVRSPSAAT
jgi:hypothetical protein